MRDVPEIVQYVIYDIKRYSHVYCSSYLFEGIFKARSEFPHPCIVIDKDDQVDADTLVDGLNVENKLFWLNPKRRKLYEVKRVV